METQGPGRGQETNVIKIDKSAGGEMGVRRLQFIYKTVFKGRGRVRGKKKGKKEYQ